MPKIAKEMKAAEVRNLKHPGHGGNAKVAVGGVPGLVLQITPTGAKSWLLRTSFGGKRKAIGLGNFPAIGLAQARERAVEALDQIRQGIDPIADRKAVRAALDAAEAKITFAEAIDGWDREHPNKFSSDKHRLIWLNSVRAVEGLQDMKVDQITEEDVWRHLEPIAERTADTARRVRGRIAEVLDWAEDEKQRSGPNPANSGWLKRKLKAKTAGAVTQNQPALQMDDAPRWFEALRQLDGVGSRALEFAALTAVRSGDVRGALWAEIDVGKGTWTIPTARMKMRRPHVVPLSAPALALLKELPVMNELVFSAPRGGKLSDATLSAAMKRMHAADLKAGNRGFFDAEVRLYEQSVDGNMVDAGPAPAVPHGLRSTFRDWCGTDGVPRELSELSLAHKFGNEVEQRYARNPLVEKRRPVMERWAAFLNGEAVAKVVQLHGGAI